MDIVDKKFVFKVSIDEYNLKKIMHVFNVMRMSNDPDIIESVCATATPVKVYLKRTFCISFYMLCIYGPFDLSIFPLFYLVVVA